MTTQERDINDIFDEVLCTEERITKASYEEGFQEGQQQASKEGFELGYKAGLQVGQELGGIYGTIVALEQRKHTEKVKQSLQRLRELIEAFPRDNNPDNDIIDALENIRTKYKQLKAMIGVKISATEADTAQKQEKPDLSF